MHAISGRKFLIPPPRNQVRQPDPPAARPSDDNHGGSDDGPGPGCVTIIAAGILLLAMYGLICLAERFN